MDTQLFSVFWYLMLTLYEGVRCCNTTIPHGQVEANCQELCLYTCDQGYEAAVASRIIKCGFLGWESYGRYVAENNLCRAKQCPYITLPNGVLSACSRFVDDTCAYNCNEGYTRKSSRIACLPTTEWDPNLHTLCTNDAQCPTFKVKNGDLDYSCNRNPGEVCTYTCHESMKPVDTLRTVTCGPNATWDKPLDSLCTVIQCPETIPSGSISPICERTYNAKCYSYECSAGYEKPTTYLYLRCNGSAQWEVISYDLKTGKDLCIDSSQLCPATVENGYISSSCNRKIGAQCTFSCNRFCSVNSRVRLLTCQSDQTWSPKVPLCWDCFTTTTAQPQCPSTVPGGRIESNCGRLSYTTCNLYCNEGCTRNLYTLYCNGYGQWDYAWDACHCYGADTNTDTSTSSEVNTGLVAGLIAAGIGFCVFLCICVLALRKNQQGNQHRRNETPVGATPVIYHEVTTNVQPTDGQRYNQPTYYTPGNQSNPPHLMSGAQTTPNAPDWSTGRASPIADTRLTPTAPDITESTSGGSEPYPPPPSYTEVITEPEKYKN